LAQGKHKSLTYILQHMKQHKKNDEIIRIILEPGGTRFIYQELQSFNPEGCGSTGQALGLLPRDHQFESHKPQDHWRLTWLLTSRSVGLVEVRASWPEHTR
jgi:hypothetical protein